MGFELGVWRVEAPIGRDAALAVFRGREFGVGGPGPGAFWSELTELVDEELLRGTEHASDYVIVRCPEERMDEVGGVVFGLARTHGLICYDPQRHLVSNLEPLSVFPELRLHTGDGLLIEQPDLGLIHDVLGRLSDENPFVALVVPSVHFLQTSEESPEEYTLEFRDSVKAQMIGTTISGLAELRETFRSYALGDLSFVDSLQWGPVDFR